MPDMPPHSDHKSSQSGSRTGESSDVTSSSTAMDTIQTLIVAFVLAMTFRGFVVEGFVIPTGSMAPTLLGQHEQVYDSQTSYDFSVGWDATRAAFGGILVSPMLGRDIRVQKPMEPLPRPRMGDRILVLKCLYALLNPSRWDVIVFKNPTDPLGPSANYIKRLVGLPDETLWLADGDVFTKTENRPEFAIQRKPQDVQRDVWQLVYGSDYIPIEPDELWYVADTRARQQFLRRNPGAEMSDRGGAVRLPAGDPSLGSYSGPPWQSDPPEAWDIRQNRSYKSDGMGISRLVWDNKRMRLDDWLAYNMLSSPQPTINLSDLRIAFDVVAQEPDSEAIVQIVAQSHVFQFVLTKDEAIVRMRLDSDGSAWTESSAPFAWPEPGKSISIECWRVDQAMYLFINGSVAVEPLLYQWSPVDRLRFATGQIDVAETDSKLYLTSIPETSLALEFSGSPITLTHLEVSRDLYYRPVMTKSATVDRNPTPPGKEHLVGLGMPGYGTRPGRFAELGPDQFYMLGDNSMLSLDSRLWGNPDPVIAAQIDDSPYLVDRRLLIGKAFFVYFPAPLPISKGGAGIVPDFSRLRFIR